MYNSAFLILLSLFASSLCANLNPYTTTDLSEPQLSSLYSTWMVTAPYNIESTPERYSLFKSKVLDIISHNENPAKTWTRTINKYTGLTLNELRGSAIMDTLTCDLTPSYEAPLTKMFKYPASLDWRDQNVVSPVKNQGDCGGCWAFAATAAVEAHWAIQTGSGPVMFSEQQLIDCINNSSVDGSCRCGLPNQAYNYLSLAGGINTENVYPYMMQQDDCIFNESVVAAQVQNGSVEITPGDEAAIIAALNEVGPISAAMDVTEDFMSYNGGVYVGTNCGLSAKEVNHAVLIVGYGTDETTGTDYWIVKNSWGRSWGEDGYFRIQRGVNMCGIADCASFPSMSTGTKTISV